MKAKCLVASLLFSISEAVLAEGGCPSGLIPYRGTDLSSCGPVPAGYYGDNGNNTSEPVAPPARWADRWGAIAFSETNNSVGVAADMGGERAAQQAAIADCHAAGGEGCKVALSYYNQCGVVAWGEKHVTTARAETINQASERAIQTCSAKSEGCKIVYSNCSLAQRIQ